MIKVDVISGFLGAGKTTLIKKLFESSFKKEKVVLIENEFGEIGIDGTFLKESGVNIKEINSGCICCSLVGDFESSMKEVINKFNPERIIIEPSGVGKLSDIVNAVLKVDADLKLNIIATVVDGPKAKMYMKNFGEFFNNQIEAANTIVVSKSDKTTEEKIQEVVDLIKEKNDHANIITTPISQLDGNKLLAVLEEKVSLKDEMLQQMIEEHKHNHDDECCCHHHHEEEHEDDHDDECCCHHHHEEEHEDDHDDGCCCHHHHEEEHEDDHDDGCCCHHHHEEEHEDDHDDECCCHHHHEEGHEHHHHHGHDADEVFTSWGKETSVSISKEQLEKFLNTLATDESLGIILRSKGILKASDNEKWYYFDYVVGDYEIRLGEPDYTGRIVVIGSKIDEHKIEELFFNRG